MVNLMPYTLSMRFKAYSALAFRLFGFPLSIVIFGNFIFIQDICCFPLISVEETITKFIFILFLFVCHKDF